MLDVKLVVHHVTSRLWKVNIYARGNIRMQIMQTRKTLREHAGMCATGWKFLMREEI